MPDVGSTTDASQMAGLITTAIKKDFVPILRNKLRFDPLAMKGQLQVNAGEIGRAHV